jgi:hypothetical protein
MPVQALDAKTGLLKQCWKCPVALLMTCCGSTSLKVILIDSDFRAYPVLNPLVTLYLTPSSRKDFFKGKNFFSHQALSRANRAPKMGGASRYGRLRQLTLSVSLVEKCIGGGWLTSNVTWTPTFRKQQLTRKGVSQRVQNHNRHRVARIEPVFWQYKLQYVSRCNVIRSPCLQQRMHRTNGT